MDKYEATPSEKIALAGQFFERISNSHKDIEKVLAEYTGVKPPYFQDFLYALNKHTKTIDDEHRLNLLYRLKCRIEDK